MIRDVALVLAATIIASPPSTPAPPADYESPYCGDYGNGVRSIGDCWLGNPDALQQDHDATALPVRNTAAGPSCPKQFVANPATKVCDEEL
jgi:hypothetical protein